MAWYGRIPDIGFSSLNLAGFLVVTVSLFYHYAVVDPANGFQNLTGLVTKYVGIATGIGLVAEKLVLE